MTPDPTAINSDFRRLEEKVDKLTDAVMRLVLIEERQTTQGGRIGKCEAAIEVLSSITAETDKKLERWVNRGIGAWGVAAVIYALMGFASKFIS